MNGAQRVEAMMNAYDDSESERDPSGESWVAMADAIADDLDTPIRWRPIEEAPKDGSLLLVAFKFDGEWAYEFAVAEAEGVTLVEFIGADPTHFCPLTPPDSKGGQ